jgi:hypothetical protein
MVSSCERPLFRLAGTKYLYRSRLIGFIMHLQPGATAAAINPVRVEAWLDGDELAPTQLSAFQRLYTAA